MPCSRAAALPLRSADEGRRLQDGPAPPGTHPDLTGLSCRFSEIRDGARSDSLADRCPGEKRRSSKRSSRLIDEVLKLAESGAEVGRPVPEGGPALRWPPPGFDLEAKAPCTTRRGRRSCDASLRSGSHAARIPHLSHRPAGRRFRPGALPPAARREHGFPQIRRRPAHDARLHARACRQDRGAARRRRKRPASPAAGLHRQTAALMTCFVPSPTRSDHVHFVDGAMGGYSAAAQAIKLA